MSKENNMGAKADPNVLLLRYISLFNLVMLVVFVGGSWYLYDWHIAQSILAGSILGSGSFFLLTRDIEQMIGRVSNSGDQFKAVKTAEKVRFLIKFYARLVVLGLLLFVLVTKVNINMIALAVGLSTIMLSIIIVFLSKGRKILSVQS